MPDAVCPQADMGQSLLWSIGAIVDLVSSSNSHLLLVNIVIALLSSYAQSHGSHQMSV